MLKQRGGVFFDVVLVQCVVPPPNIIPLVHRFGCVGGRACVEYALFQCHSNRRCVRVSAIMLPSLSWCYLQFLVMRTSTHPRFYPFPNTPVGYTNTDTSITLLMLFFDRLLKRWRIRISFPFAALLCHSTTQLTFCCFCFSFLRTC